MARAKVRRKKAVQKESIFGEDHPKNTLTYDKLKAFCRMCPTLDDTMAFFDVSANTLLERCKEYEGITFREFRDKYIVHTRMDLKRRAIKMAHTNPVMMKYVLNNISDWEEKKQVSGEIKVNTMIDWLHGSDDEDENVIDVNPKEVKKLGKGQK